MAKFEVVGRPLRVSGTLHKPKTKIELSVADGTVLAALGRVKVAAKVVAERAPSPGPAAPDPASPPDGGEAQAATSPSAAEAAPPSPAGGEGV